MNINLISLIKTAVITGIVAGVLVFIGLKFMQNRAVETCITAGYEEYKNSDGNSTSRIPSWRTYNICMNEKGYKTTVNSK